MKAVLALCVFVAVCTAATVPKWPQQYYVKGTFSIPYWNITGMLWRILQKVDALCGDLRICCEFGWSKLHLLITCALEPLEINYDATNNRQSFNYYDGMDNYIWRYDLSTLYQVIPRIDTLVSWFQNFVTINISLIVFWCRFASLLTSLAAPLSRKL